MKQPVSIRIEKPCHEDWNAMTPNERGRFCGSCQKTVTDFTAMTDNEILEALQNRSGSMCGQLRGSQLNRVLVQTHLERNKWTLNTAFTALLLAAGTGFMTAQTAPVPTNASTEIRQKYPICPNPRMESSGPATEKHVIKAQVIDSTSQHAMPFTTVMISGTQIRTTTDAEGNFELTIPDSLAGRAITLTILAPGYAAEYLTLNATEINSLRKVVIAFDERHFKGEMIIIDNSRRIDNR
jgi:hypothetical protein